MGDVTISESHYNKLKEANAKARAEVKLAREEAERTGWTTFKEGRKGEGLKQMGAASMPALQTMFAGAAIYYVATEWFNNITLFKEHWWAKPLAVVVLGYGLWRKQGPSVWATALLSAGAAMFAQAWRARPGAKKDNTTQGPDDEAGRWDWSEDTYGRGRWVETPHGGRTYLTEGPGVRAAERIADRVFEHAAAA